MLNFYSNPDTTRKEIPVNVFVVIRIRKTA